MKLLLDTHILLHWFAGGGRLTGRQLELLAAASGDEPLLLADISLWEIATLVNLGRVELKLPLRDWLEQATAPPLVRRIAISPAIAADVAALPDSFHRDPADRLIVSTARVLGATLMTNDRRIIDSRLVEIARLR